MNPFSQYTHLLLELEQIEKTTRTSTDKVLIKPKESEDHSSTDLPSEQSGSL